MQKLPQTKPNLDLKGHENRLQQFRKRAEPQITGNLFQILKLIVLQAPCLCSSEFLGCSVKAATISPANLLQFLKLDSIILSGLKYPKHLLYHVIWEQLRTSRMSTPSPPLYVPRVSIQLSVMPRQSLGTKQTVLLVASRLRGFSEKAYFLKTKT